MTAIVFALLAIIELSAQGTITKGVRRQRRQIRKRNSRWQAKNRKEKQSE